MIQTDRHLAALLGAGLELFQRGVVNGQTVTFSHLVSSDYTDSANYGAIDYAGITSKDVLTPESNFSIVGHAKVAMSTTRFSPMGDIFLLILNDLQT
jgi:hypothetical protein